MSRQLQAGECYHENIALPRFNRYELGGSELMASRNVFAANFPVLTREVYRWLRS
jgi:hypothetical protein